jgi:hypothetical protein
MVIRRSQSRLVGQYCRQTVQMRAQGLEGKLDRLRVFLCGK